MCIRDSLNTRRREIAQQYQQALAALPFQPLSLPAWPHVHAWHLFIIRVDEQRCGISRDALMEALKERGIGTGLHFRAAHTQKYYRERFPTLSLPNTEWNSERICSLPLFPDMTTADADRVITGLSHCKGGDGGGAQGRRTSGRSRSGGTCAAASHERRAGALPRYGAYVA